MSRSLTSVCCRVDYQRCLSEVRGPLVDLGVSEYGILSAIATLSETQNDLGLTNQQPDSPSYTSDDVTLFRQIALDLRELESPPFQTEPLCMNHYVPEVN